MPPKVCTHKRSEATCEYSARILSEPNPKGRNIYGLTCRHNPKYKEDGTEYNEVEKRVLYERLIGALQQKGLKVENLYYERKNGLHFHCKIESPSKLYFKRWNANFPKFHLMFKPVYDEAGWLSYCQKEQEATFLNYFMNEYAFSQSSDE